MSGHVPSGFYLSAEGTLMRDRRLVERRHSPRGDAEADRRGFSRRAADREIVEREHHSMIEEALAEFAAEHEMF
jgi:hypothetical protein